MTQLIENKSQLLPLIDTHRGLGAPPGTTFEFPFSSFVCLSPVHPCELKSMQLIENKGSGASQLGTPDDPTRVVVPPVPSPAEGSDQREPRDLCRLRMLHEN
jgi:hypothetical protein